MRGFAPGEYEDRCARAQALMAEQDLAALLLTTDAEIRYFTGFLTRFWESPTRPWFLLLPSTGKPVAVIPAIGAAPMGRTWIEDIRSWNSPDPADDGVSLLTEALLEIAPEGARIGVPDGPETHLRMPLGDFERVRSSLGSRRFASDGGIMRTLRMVKSPTEIAKIETACTIAGSVFRRVPEIARTGVALSEVARRFQMICLEEGADWVSYLAAAANQDGYDDIITPAGETPLVTGDVLMLDTGLVWDGYFSDFNRNWALGPASHQVRSAHHRLVEASDAAFAIARPGTTASDLYHTMHRTLGASTQGSGAGRLGHGLGMSLTEWPSLTPSDHTVLETGMVLTLEPWLPVGGRMLVHEEVIVMTEDAARLLSPRAGPEIPEI